MITLYLQYLLRSGCSWLLFLEAPVVFPELCNCEWRGRRKLVSSNRKWGTQSCFPCWSNCILLFLQITAKAVEHGACWEIYEISPFFLSFPNWIHSGLFLAVPAAEVMWPYICFTLTGPFYIIHYVQPQCPLLIRANPAFSWRAALTSVPAAFQLSPGQLWLL